MTMKPPRCLSPIADQWDLWEMIAIGHALQLVTGRIPRLLPVERIGMEIIDRRDEADLLKLPGLPECIIH